MGSKSQAKGRRGEIELADLLRCYGYNVRPGEPLNYGKEPDLVGLPHVHCEVKRTEKMKMGEWLDQAQRDSERFGGVPAVFHRSNRRPWTVTMLLKDWMELYLTAERQKPAEKAGISPRTLRSYLADAEFQEEYKKAFSGLITDVTRQAQQSLSPALSVLRGIVEDDSEDAKVRVTAARSLLEYGLRLTEITDILRDLEGAENVL